MKKFLLMTIALVGLVFAFVACSNNNSSSTQEEVKTEEKAIEEAEKSNKIETDIFLGFKIGMSKKEYEDHYSNLLKQGRITEWAAQPRYKITTKDGWEGTLTFGAKTYKDSVYSMTFLILDESLDAAAHTHLISSFKAADKSKMFEIYTRESTYNSTIIETYIKDNLVIQFGLNRMTYYDAPTEAIIKKLEQYEQEVQEAEKKKRGDASVDDF